MRAALAAAIAGAVMFVAGVQASGVQPGVDPQSFDHDGDGLISILDFAIMAPYFTQIVGTPYPCVPREHYVTPVTAYTFDLTPYLVEGRSYPATDDPRFPALMSGTAVVFVPC